MLYYEIISELKKKAAYCFDDAVCLSYAVPEIENGIRVDKAFLYRNTLDTSRTRPFAVLVTAADDGRIVLLADCHYSDFVDPGRFPFSRKLDYRMPEKESVEDFQMEQHMIRKLYEAVRLFAFQKGLGLEQKQLLEKYHFLFSHAVPKDLIPFYEALSPRFEAWIQSEIY
ncbi:MAG: hypothetical protein IJ899_10370 [Blautia sp.]|nr:hypothetical protein [Blautia sp.]